MNAKYYFLVALLCLGFGLSGCITHSQVENRAIELPSGDPNATMTTAEQICSDLIANGFGKDIQQKFPELNDNQMQGVFLTSNEGTFSQSGHTVFIMTGIKYTGTLPNTKDIADYCESLVRKAVSAKFTASTGSPTK